MTLGQDFSQLKVFVVLFVVGFLFSLTYFAVARFFVSKLFCAIWDLVYGTSFVCVVTYVNLHVNNGEFRLFVPISVFLGWILFAFCFNGILDKVFVTLYNLFTLNKVDKNDGTHLLHKEKVNIVCDGNFAASSTCLHAVDGSCSTPSGGTTRRTTCITNQAGKTR